MLNQVGQGGGGDPSASSLVIEGVDLVDGTGSPVRRSVTVEVADGRITSISDGASAGTPAPGPSVEIIDGSGCTLIPGVFDCHVHLTHPYADASIWGGMPGRTLTVAERTVHAVAAARRALETGFTTIRDLGAIDPIFAVRTYTSSVVDAGPEILAAGEILCTTGGHGSNLFGHECDGPEGVRAGARLQLKKGADVLKVCASGGAATPNEEITSLQFDEDELRAAVVAAARNHKRVACHAHATEAIQTAIRAGVTSIEHGVMIDDETAQMMADTGTFLVPTLSVYKALVEVGPSKGLPDFAATKARQVREMHMKSLQAAMNAGVRIGFGTDGGGPYHPPGSRESLAAEFALMREAGMSTEEAVRTATLTSAEVCGLEREVGSVEVGKQADLVLLGGDLTSGPEVIVNTRAVVRRGSVVHRT